MQTRSCLFLGFGLGYSAISWAENFPDDSIILVEPNPKRFFSALLAVDWTSVFRASHVVLALAAGADLISQIVESEGGLENCKIVKNPSQIAHAPLYFSAVESNLSRNQKKDEINRATFSRFEKIWKRNISKNVEFLKNRPNVRSVSDFYGAFSGKPFLILAAGPTLFDFLPILSRLQNRVVVVCVDTALKFCLRVGFQPDFIVLTDPQYAAFRHVAGLFSPKSSLVTEIAAYPSVFHLRVKNIVLSSSNCPLEKLQIDEKTQKEDSHRGILRSGGSVSTAAWDFARVCGASEIFMAGLDLGYPDGQTHVRGATFEEESHFLSNRLSPSETRLSGTLFGANVCLAENYDGEKILTDDRMKLFAWWFEGKVAQFSDLPTYSLSTRSLKIPGFKTISPNDFLSRI